MSPRALAQRRQPERHHVEPVVEVLAEAPVARPPPRDRGWWPRPRARRPCTGARRADALAARASCRTRSSFACTAEGQLADLVEEERPAVGELEPAQLALVRAGERALLVAEELALEQRLGERGARHLHERTRSARRLSAVDRSHDQLLPGPGLPCHEDGRVGRGHLAHLRTSAWIAGEHRPGRRGPDRAASPRAARRSPPRAGARARAAPGRPGRSRARRPSAPPASRRATRRRACRAGRPRRAPSSRRRSRVASAASGTTSAAPSSRRAADGGTRRTTPVPGGTSRRRDDQAAPDRHVERVGRRQHGVLRPRHAARPRRRAHQAARRRSGSSRSRGSGRARHAGSASSSSGSRSRPSSSPLRRSRSRPSRCGGKSRPSTRRSARERRTPSDGHRQQHQRRGRHRGRPGESRGRATSAAP